ncbi:MAG: alcohol dehydrogenase catalytic domain-containing protein [Chloroflexota bacterium]|nr:alcohol dehydrogenase catalytic domain-containing protein [Chloroflexota bacterium]
MKALISMGPRQLKFGDWEDPGILPGQVLIEVAACGICGTDLHVYNGLPAPWPVPGIRGHEFAGKVIAWADDVEGFQDGDRVVAQPLLYCGGCRFCRSGQSNLCSKAYLIGGEQPGGFAEQVAVPARALFQLPENLSLKRAALVETLATSVHAFEQNLSGLLRNVAVLGAGAQGLFAVQLARLAGAKLIAVSEVAPHRLAMARKLGATHVVNARQENVVEAIGALTGGEGVDLVIEAAGKALTRQQAIQLLRPGGTAIFLALGAEASPIDFMSVVPRELHLRGTQCYTDADFALAIELLANGEIICDPLITEMPLDKGPAAFEKLSVNPGEAIKVLLEP